MKKIIICLLSALAAIGAVQAKKMSDLKIYINPGHGGYDSNDRPITLEIFAAGDTAGYWESKSNLYKGLHFYHILDSLGATPYLSRIKNTTADDRDLNGIALEANRLGVDLFFSIHSNAGESTNFPLMLYREETRGVPRYPENVTLSNIHWANLYSNKLPVWSRTTPYVEGDINFYWSQWKTGLGVLRNLRVVGLLSEGSNHEHRPEAYRLMNDDYLWLEAWHFVRTIMEYYDTEDRFTKGNVAGIVYDTNNNKQMQFKTKFSTLGRDVHACINGAYIELLDMNGNLVQKRTTDNMYNGVFVFRNVAPGQYKLRASHDNYHTEETIVTVEADKVTYNDMPLVMKRPGHLEVTSISPADNAQAVSCSASVEINFNYDIDVPEFEKNFKITPEVDGYLSYSNSYKTVTFKPNISFVKNTEYTVSIGAGTRSADTYNPDPTVGQELNYKFTTAEYDKVELLSSYPDEGGTVDYRSPVLEFRFDAKIKSTGLKDQIVVKDADGAVLAYKSRTGVKVNSLSNGFGNAIMTLDKDFIPGNKYTVTLNWDIRSTENLPYDNTKVINFTAVDNGKEKDGDMVEDFERTTDMFVADTENNKDLTSSRYYRSTSSKLFGTSSAMFEYNFTNFRLGEAYWNYIPADEENNILINNGDKLIIHVNGDFNDHELYLTLTGGGDTKYFKVCDVNFKGWKYFEVPVEGLLDGTPYIFKGIRLNQTESPICQKGSFAVDNMTLVKDNGAVEGIFGDPDNKINIFAADGKIEIKAEGSVIATLYDMLGRIVTRTSETSFEAPAGQYVLKVQGHDSTVARRISL